MDDHRIIIGLTGVARSGKDTAARGLIEAHGFTRLAFADLLRKVAYDVDPFVQGTAEEPRGLARLLRLLRLLRRPPSPTYERLSELVDRVGWEAAKASPDVRRLLQRLGTEGGRENLGTNMWVDPVMRQAMATSGPVVITDVRFPNEVDAVRSAGGLVVRIIRPGYEPINSHASDVGITSLPVDLELVNDGTVDDLHDQVSALYRRISGAQVA